MNFDAVNAIEVWIFGSESEPKRSEGLKFLGARICSTAGPQLNIVLAVPKGDVVEAAVCY